MLVEIKIVAATLNGLQPYKAAKLTLLTASGTISSIIKIEATNEFKFVKKITIKIPISGKKICFTKLICKDKCHGIDLILTLNRYIPKINN